MRNSQIMSIVGLLRHGSCNHLTERAFPGLGKARKWKIGQMEKFSMTKTKESSELQLIDYKIITKYFSGRAAILKSSFFQPFRGTYAFAHTLYTPPP